MINKAIDKIRKACGFGRKLSRYEYEEIEPSGTVEQAWRDVGESMSFLDRMGVHDEELRKEFLESDGAKLRESMLCGHPRSSIVSSGEGTSYCSQCESES